MKFKKSMDIKLKYNNVGLLDVQVHSDKTIELTYTPNPEEFQHYHLDIDVVEAKKLRNWLNKALED